DAQRPYLLSLYRLDRLPANRIAPPTTREHFFSPVCLPPYSFQWRIFSRSRYAGGYHSISQRYERSRVLTCAGVECLLNLRYKRGLEHARSGPGMAVVVKRVSDEDDSNELLSGKDWRRCLQHQRIFYRRPVRSFHPGDVTQTQAVER